MNTNQEEKLAEVRVGKYYAYKFQREGYGPLWCDERGAISDNGYISLLESLASRPVEDEWITEGMPEFDGDYLCFIEQGQECGNIITYQRVVGCMNNTWTRFHAEVIKAWRKLPPPPRLKGSV